MLDRAAARARRADRIAADYTNLAREIICACPSPPRHYWDVPRQRELYWWAGDVIESTRHGASLFLRRMPTDSSDPDQLHVEVRWFPKDDGPHRPGHRRLHSAIVWCEQGPRNGGFRNLLDAPESFPKAETIESLAAAIAATLCRILWP